MEKSEVQAYRRLKDGGVDVQKRNQIRFNSGSESLNHVIAKTITGHIALQHDYRVSSEVELSDGSEIDVVLWGNPDRLSYAVEIEHTPQPETIESKVNRYVYQTSVDDIIIINADEIPTDMQAAYEFIEEQLGLQ